MSTQPKQSKKPGQILSSSYSAISSVGDVTPATPFTVGDFISQKPLVESGLTPETPLVLSDSESEGPAQFESEPDDQPTQPESDTAISSTDVARFLSLSFSTTADQTSGSNQSEPERLAMLTELYFSLKSRRGSGPVGKATGDNAQASLPAMRRAST